MGTRSMDGRRLCDVYDRLRRLRWLGLWLLARHSLVVWFAVPSTPAPGYVTTVEAEPCARRR